MYWIRTALHMHTDFHIHTRIHAYTNTHHTSLGIPKVWNKCLKLCALVAEDEVQQVIWSLPT